MFSEDFTFDPGKVKIGHCGQAAHCVNAFRIAFPFSPVRRDDSSANRGSAIVMSFLKLEKLIILTVLAGAATTLTHTVIHAQPLPQENDGAETALPLFTGFIRPQKEEFCFLEPMTFQEEVFNHGDDDIDATVAYVIRRVSDGMPLGGIKSTSRLAPHDGWSFPAQITITNAAATAGEYEAVLSVEYGNPPKILQLDKRKFLVLP